MSSLQQSLGRYLNDGPETIDSVDILCPMLNIDNEWIWAEADKKDWDRVIQELQRTRKMLAIRERKASRSAPELDRPFYKGPVFLTYGEKIDGLTKWTTNNSAIYIDRPASFKVS
jgi:hypothetical protein